MRVLDVVDVQHHVVGHLKREVELLQFLGRRGIGCLRGIERAH